MLTVQVNENQLVELESILGHAADPSELSRLQRELEQKSNRIKAALSLRLAPIQLDLKDIKKPGVRFNGICGSIALFNNLVEVSPKIHSGDRMSDWHEVIMHILARIRGGKYSYEAVTGRVTRPTRFVDHVALAYSEAIVKASRLESIEVYRSTITESEVLRGRLLVSQTAMNVLSRPNRLVCEVDYLDTNNSFNHLLHWAAQHLWTRIIDLQARNRLDVARSLLPKIEPPWVLPSKLPLTVPPQFRHYSSALDIANGLAQGTSPMHSLGSSDTAYGYFLNMERIYELFVEKSLQAILGRIDPEKCAHLAVQESKLYAHADGTGVRDYYTRPDNVLYIRGVPRLLVDAKYKSIRDAENGSWRRPRNSDIYQLAASLVAHDCDRGLLLYPESSSWAARKPADSLRSWRVPKIGRSARVFAATVDLSMLTSADALRAFDSDLAVLIDLVTS